MSTSTTAPRKEMAKIRLVFDDDVYKKIMYWIDKAPGEVSGLGKITIDPDGTFKVISAILLEQENTSASTDIDSNAIGKAMYETREDPGHLNFWWHSHVNMDCFWSGTDLDTIRDIGAAGFVVASVLNKKGACRTAYFMRGDVLPEVFIDELPTTVAASQPYVNTLWDTEYESKVKTKTYAPIYGSYGESWDRSYYGGTGYRDEKKNDEMEIGEGEETRETEEEANGSGSYAFEDDFWRSTLQRSASLISAEEYDTLTDLEKDIVDKARDEIKRTQFDFTEHEIQDEIKIATIEKDVNELALGMPLAANSRHAINMLYAICSHINRAKITDPSKAKKLREKYITIYNYHHGTRNGKVIEIKQPKELQEKREA